MNFHLICLSTPSSSVPLVPKAMVANSPACEPSAEPGAQYLWERPSSLVPRTQKLRITAQRDRHMEGQTH